MGIAFVVVEDAIVFVVGDVEVERGRLAVVVAVEDETHDVDPEAGAVDDDEIPAVAGSCKPVGDVEVVADNVVDAGSCQLCAHVF